MFTISKLPRFVDYLNSYYHHLYEVYAGKLTELFPSYDGSEANLAVQDSEEGSSEEKEQVMTLWKQFE
jgi:hypothetical protein